MLYIICEYVINVSNEDFRLLETRGPIHEADIQQLLS